MESGIKNPAASLAAIGLNHTGHAFWNLSPAELVEHTLQRGMGVMADSGALVVDTGKFRGRAPKDKFTVKDAKTTDTVDWNNFNIPTDNATFDKLYAKVLAYLSDKDIWVRDNYACADPKYRINIRVINEYPWGNMFCDNMFMRPTAEEIKTMNPDWLIINAPGFQADPAVDNTRDKNFAMIDFTKRIILIGGTGYTGEMKKGIFTVLNYWLPQEKGVLSMHCSANVGKEGDVAVFFGLSGTGKTTLSADPDRRLIGDDEHGWTEEGVFNFEGGCYAKCVNLTRENEPQIFNAIKFGAILENVEFIPGTRTVDFTNITKTENTRVSYPIHFIDNIMVPSKGGLPKNIFFLTCDAFGVLPPISKLTPGQAMYQFLSGYTAKVAGTEAGVTEPQLTFSTCFGAPFLPLHPTKYAELLGEKMRKHNVNIWLINTGWTGGAYGTGKRMKLSYTRAMITAALNGELDSVSYATHDVFGLHFPTTCPNVPTEVLDPRNTWSDKQAYDAKANNLAAQFVKNFEKYADKANAEIMAAAPKAGVSA
ncbi:MAG TPA: phosphoenolpyruvate carboxykinase (ATP) [Chitinophagales bacterium]|nr:phosphoenolpyruvate carboxykinase (ATP) [Chitinophagales bacterium]HNF68098.1 phosphoenolpyruvate carboxykinase (ATP) [Chitinophagales bacterium]HNJ88637.1 phosphoenolpyruvate carboxykinase (ATP) [Chitinophagales bacterium]HNM07389.1 phosphoenolpyruvate carboxykinase (ATP) [Chitinophagales bacterium]HNM28643.1 phosphoenolpyruvate carboxykinase (ATP) [Chitinophagales bacterium]